MENPKIYGAITGIMSDVGAIGKDSVNEQQRFRYRGIDAVMNALQPAFIKHGVFVYPEILEHAREERDNTKGTHLIYSVIKVAYHFTATDGSEVVVTVIGEGMDPGDKATNKALSIAFKYACFQLFCIPTEEMKDPDAETHEVLPAKISPVKVQTIRTTMAKVGVTEEQICKRYKVAALEDLLDTHFKGVMDALKASEKK
jgi:hypothetical protein